MTTELRVLDKADWEVWYETLKWAFGGLPESSETRDLWRDLTEADRSLAMWDADRIVGTAGTYSFGLSVPGGDIVPAAGLAMVSVASTHRRRGILRRMMRRQLDDVRAAGEPLAVLTASDPAIYGRFGYSLATQQLSARIDTDRVRLELPPGTDEVRPRLVDMTEEAERCEDLYAQQVMTRPGMLARRAGWERLPLLDPAASRGGGSPQTRVLAERDGELLGYARYRLKPDWDRSGANGTVLVHDLEATEPAAYAALLRFLMEIDLMSVVELPNRPVDDPLLHLVSDIRRCAIGIRDALYLRPVDVPAALTARRYAADVDVVLEVSDEFCPWNTGRWRLTGDSRAAACERTTTAVDLELSVRELGAVYLGGTSLAALANAGRVRESRPGALAAASLAFSAPVAPWLPHGF